MADTIEKRVGDLEYIIAHLPEDLDARFTGVHTKLAELREVQALHTQRFTTLERRSDERFTALERGLAALDRKMDEGLARVDRKIDEGLAAQDRKFAELDRKLDAALALLAKLARD